LGDFTAITNSTDVKAKIPTAGMACKIPKITVPSCGTNYEMMSVQGDLNISREKYLH
jgi:hypothetical protein